jgi:hypothetical protein
MMLSLPVPEAVYIFSPILATQLEEDRSLLCKYLSTIMTARITRAPRDDTFGEGVVPRPEPLSRTHSPHAPPGPGLSFRR